MSFELSRKKDMSCPLLCFNKRKQFSKLELAILSSLRIARHDHLISETVHTSSFEMEMHSSNVHSSQRNQALQAYNSPFSIITIM